MEGIKGRPTVKLNGIFSLLDKLKYCNTIDEVIQNISSLEAFYLYILGCCRPNLNMEYKSDLSGRLGFIDCRIPYFDFKWGLINASEFIDLECALGIGHGQILLPPDIIQNLGNSLAEIQNNKTTKL